MYADDDSQLHISYEPELMRFTIDYINSDLEGVVCCQGLGMKRGKVQCSPHSTASLSPDLK